MAGVAVARNLLLSPRSSHSAELGVVNPHAVQAAVLSHMQQVGSDVLVAHDPTNVVTLHDVVLANLHASDSISCETGR